MFLRLVLATLSSVGILLLQVTLMGIARFFQRTSGRRTWYRFYLLNILITAFAAGRYILRIPQTEAWPDFIGDPIATILFFIAGLALFLLGGFLYECMMGEPKK